MHGGFDIYIIVNELPSTVYEQRFAIKNRGEQIQDGFFLFDDNHATIQNYMSYVFNHKQDVLNQIGESKDGGFRYIRKAFDLEYGLNEV